MKRKYYIRGLGFGIVITALVFSFLNSPDPSDEEIIKRAKELGYVLATEVTPGFDLDELLSSGTPAPTQTPEPTDIPAPTQTPEPTEVPEETQTPVPTEVPQETLTPTPTETPEATADPTATVAPTQTPVPTENPAPVVVKASINVVRGNSASQVCKLMEEAGIVSDWEDLREYLVQNDLVDYINIGTFEVSSDMTFAEIAHILTGR